MRQGKKQRLSDRSFEAKKRAFDAVAKMRHDKLSLEAAARDAGTKAGTVRKYLPAALKRKSGRWIATKSDSYLRVLRIPGPQGPVTVRARGSKQAQFVSNYLSSVLRWSGSKRAYELRPFEGKKISGVELLTSPRALEALRDAGLLQLDSLYAALKDTL